MFYCGSIGAEYMHLTQAAEQLWVQARLEVERSNWRLTAADKRTILERLIAAEGLEKYLHGRYPGVKRFGLEGRRVPDSLPARTAAAARRPRRAGGRGRHGPSAGA